MGFGYRVGAVGGKSVVGVCLGIGEGEAEGFEGVAEGSAGGWNKVDELGGCWDGRGGGGVEGGTSLCTEAQPQRR